MFSRLAYTPSVNVYIHCGYWVECAVDFLSVDKQSYCVGEATNLSKLRHSWAAAVEIRDGVAAARMRDRRRRVRRVVARQAAALSWLRRPRHRP